MLGESSMYYLNVQNNNVVDALQCAQNIAVFSEHIIATSAPLPWFLLQVEYAYIIFSSSSSLV